MCVFGANGDWKLDAATAKHILLGLLLVALCASQKSTVFCFLFSQKRSNRAGECNATWTNNGKKEERERKVPSASLCVWRQLNINEQIGRKSEGTRVRKTQGWLVAFQQQPLAVIQIALSTAKEKAKEKDIARESLSFTVLWSRSHQLMVAFGALFDQSVCGGKGSWQK